MSYPLVQFSSDTVTKTGSARALRINLISLLLSGLADVVIFGEVEAIIELFHHHKVLYKCLDLASDVLCLKVQWCHYETQQSPFYVRIDRF